MEALLIHYYFPPIHSIGVVRNYHFACEWEKRCNTLKILTTQNAHILPSDMHYDTSRFDITYLKTNDTRTKLAKRGHVHLSEDKKKGFINQFLIKTLHTYPFNIYFGEGGMTYIKHGIEQGREFLAQYPKATIYSSFRPYSDHVIAATLKKDFPQCRWIADFRDADIDPLYKLYLNKSWQIRFNKKVLKLADKIITVSDGVKNLMEGLHPHIQTVQSGFEIRENSSKFDTFTICYTGSLYGNHRDPTPLFQALKQLLAQNAITNDFRLVYAGKDGFMFREIANQHGMGDFIEDFGSISLIESHRLQEKSHIALLLTSSDNGYQGVLTGKLYEYLGSQTPILGLVKGPRDREIANILAKVNHAEVFYSSDGCQGLQSFLLSKYKQWNSQPLNYPKTHGLHIQWSDQFNQLLL